MNKHCRGCIRYLKSCSGLSKAVCEKHKLRIPRTNADRIRSMSDEELAEWIETIADCRVCKIDEGHCSGGELNTRASCMIHWLYWLRQEAPYDQP